MGYRNTKTLPVQKLIGLFTVNLPSVIDVLTENMMIGEFCLWEDDRAGPSVPVKSLFGWRGLYEQLPRKYQFCLTKFGNVFPVRRKQGKIGLFAKYRYLGLFAD